MPLAMKLTGSSLLLLEDEALLRRRIAAHLEKEGVEVTLAATLAEAREALRNVSFDFALLDVNLPDTTGLDIAETSRLPLARLLQGGTWTAGRRIASERRPGGAPPIRIATDGTTF